jgi:hypothetical protein
MKYGSIKFSGFLEENGISPYFLHNLIKKRMSNFKNQILIYESTIASNQFCEECADHLNQIDSDILQSIRSYLIQRVQKKATNDKEILIALKKLKWTKKIKESELRAMGLQAKLFGSTTILGKLKLVRIGDYLPCYYLLPIGKRLHIKKIIGHYLISKKKEIVKPV